jgi:AraC-like DNA-binding protein
LGPESDFLGGLDGAALGLELKTLESSMPSNPRQAPELGSRASDPMPEAGRFTLMAGPVTAIAKALEYKGLDSRSVFHELGVRQAIRNEPTDRMSVSATAALLRHCAEVTCDPYFGLTVAKFIRVSNIHALGYALLASKTLLDFCLRLERYFALVTQSVTLRVEREPHEIALRFHPLIRIAGEAEDGWTAFMLHLMRLLYRPDFSPSRVGFRHPCPLEGPGPYVACFGVLPSFEQPELVVGFSAAVMEESLSGASLELAQYNDTIARDYLARLNKADIVNRVRVKIIERLSSGDCNRRKVARDLGMSERTLHHKLAQYNASFQTLLDEIRKELALGYLADRAISVTETTFLLGFSDVSNFTRAFKRWTGTSPTMYRSQKQRSVP